MLSYYIQWCFLLPSQPLMNKEERCVFVWFDLWCQTQKEWCSINTLYTNSMLLLTWPKWSKTLVVLLINITSNIKHLVSGKFEYFSLIHWIWSYQGHWITSRKHFFDLLKGTKLFLIQSKLQYKCSELSLERRSITKANYKNKN